MTPAVTIANSNSPPAIRLMAPASEAAVKVRIPAGARAGPAALAAFAFDADQQPDAERDREAENEGSENADVLRRRADCRASARPGKTRFRTQ